MMSCACGTGMWEALCHSHRHHMTTGRLRNKGRERIKTERSEEKNSVLTTEKLLIQNSKVKTFFSALKSALAGPANIT